MTRVNAGGAGEIGLRSVLFMDGDVLTEVVPSVEAVVAHPELLAQHERSVGEQLARLTNGVERFRIASAIIATILGVGATVREWLTDPSWVHRVVSLLLGAFVATAPLWLARRIVLAVVRREINRLRREN
jgi:hypothetical protein